MLARLVERRIEDLPGRYASRVTVPLHGTLFTCTLKTFMKMLRRRRGSGPRPSSSGGAARTTGRNRPSAGLTRPSPGGGCAADHGRRRPPKGHGQKHPPRQRCSEEQHEVENPGGGNERPASRWIGSLTGRRSEGGGGGRVWGVRRQDAPQNGRGPNSLRSGILTGNNSAPPCCEMQESQAPQRFSNSRQKQSRRRTGNNRGILHPHTEDFRAQMIAAARRQGRTGRRITGGTFRGISEPVIVLELFSFVHSVYISFSSASPSPDPGPVLRAPAHDALRVKTGWAGQARPW